MKQNIYTIVNEAINEVFNRLGNVISEHHRIQLAERKLPEKYIQYIENVAKNVQIHNEPLKIKKVERTMTQPSELFTSRAHIIKKQRWGIERSEQKEVKIKKQNMNTNFRIKAKNTERPKLTSKENNILKNNCKVNLIPIQTQQFYEEEEINFLRSRKVKIEEALNAFNEESKRVKVVQLKKQKGVSKPAFTTDYLGHLLNFNSIKKAKHQPELNLIYKIGTHFQHGITKKSNIVAKKIRDNGEQYMIFS